MLWSLESVSISRCVVMIPVLIKCRVLKFGEFGATCLAVDYSTHKIQQLFGPLEVKHLEALPSP